jgi:pimeloyl-ACP methyl ester carboxylesterase
MSETASPSTPASAVSLPGIRHSLTLPGGGTVTLYESSPTGLRSSKAAPLLLVHSINATASAFEMLPVAQRQARRRTVLALDLPGFGLSDKPPAHYTPQRMREAVDAAIDWIGEHVTPAPADVMALSLGCEFATQAVLRRPARVRTVTLISPTGMEGQRRDERFEDGRTREQPWLRRLLRETRLGGVLYRVLTTRPVMRRFLARSWGTASFDQRLLVHGHVCADLPGAQHAPLDFVSGSLFTRGIIERYRALPVPVWVVHGNQGSFTDFDACPLTTGGGAGVVGRTVIDGGAMPHFQSADAFDSAYEAFLGGMRPQPEPEPPTRAAREWERQLAAELNNGR